MTDEQPINEQNSDREPQLEEALPTQQVPDESASLADPTEELRMISFYLPSRSDPIVSKEDIVTIGRRDPKRGISPTLDLSEERGAQLGVSRLHAEITYDRGRYSIKDMGSSNGTWVNNSKLAPYQPHPLSTGDQLRFGQLAVLVHITLPQPTPRSTSASKLVDTLTGSDYSFRLTTTSSRLSLVQAQGGFAPILLDTMGNIVQTVERLYAIVREAQEQEAEGFSIIHIRTEPMEGALLVDVKGAVDVLDFLINKLPQFVKVLEGGEAVSLTSEMEAAIETATGDQYDTIPEQVAEYLLQELVYRYLHDERKEYVQRLAPHLDDLISSTLKMERVQQ